MQTLHVCLSKGIAGKVYVTLSAKTTSDREGSMMALGVDHGQVQGTVIITVTTLPASSKYTVVMA